MDGPECAGHHQTALKDSCPPPTSPSLCTATVEHTTRTDPCIAVMLQFNCSLHHRDAVQAVAYLTLRSYSVTLLHQFLVI